MTIAGHRIAHMKYKHMHDKATDAEADMGVYICHKHQVLCMTCTDGMQMMDK